MPHEIDSGSWDGVAHDLIPQSSNPLRAGAAVAGTELADVLLAGFASPKTGQVHLPRKRAMLNPPIGEAAVLGLQKMGKNYPFLT